eukprot:6950806-Pyramimonas_sp.AAC.1
MTYAPIVVSHRRIEPSRRRVSPHPGRPALPRGWATVTPPGADRGSPSPQPLWSLAHWQGNSSNYGTGPCPHTSSNIAGLSTGEKNQ